MEAHDDFLSIREAAERASMSEGSIRWMIRKGLPVYRLKPRGKIWIYWPEFVKSMRRFRVVMSEFDPKAVQIVQELLSGR